MSIKQSSLSPQASFYLKFVLSDIRIATSPWFMDRFACNTFSNLGLSLWLIVRYVSWGEQKHNPDFLYSLLVSVAPLENWPWIKNYNFKICIIPLIWLFYDVFLDLVLINWCWVFSLLLQWSLGYVYSSLQTRLWLLISLLLV